MGPGETQGLAEALKKHETTKDVYVKLLGLNEFPRSPEETPNRILIPTEALGSLKSSIIDSNLDRRERGQKIFWNSKTGSFEAGKVILGTKTTTTLPLIDSAIKIYFGRKALIYYHTHPPNTTTSYYPEDLEISFSKMDIGEIKASPRLAFIYLVVSNPGISALFQTEVSSRLPFSSDIASANARAFLEKEDYFGHPRDYGSFSEIASIMERLGFGFYLFYPKRGYGQKKDLKQGLTLFKVPSKGR